MPYLHLELFPHSVLFVGLDDDVEIVEVFDDEVVPLVHRQKNLLHRRITGRQYANAVFSFRETIWNMRGGIHQVRRTPKFWYFRR